MLWLMAHRGSQNRCLWKSCGVHICSQALSLGHGTSSSVFWVLMRNTILSRILMLLPNESRIRLLKRSRVSLASGWAPRLSQSGQMVREAFLCLSPNMGARRQGPCEWSPASGLVMARANSASSSPLYSAFKPIAWWPGPPSRSVPCHVPNSSPQ